MMNVSNDMHTVARLLLDSVQQMDVERYRAIARALDYRLSMKMPEDADNCDLHDLALLARAMRLIMIEHAAGSEARDADQERVRTLYDNARSEILRNVQGFGVDPDDPRPLHALSKRIQLDSWPIGGRDREIVTALEQAYQSLLRAPSPQSAQPDVHEREAPEADAMPQAGGSANAGSSDETYALARRLLDAVQQMDATAYHALVVDIDALVVDSLMLDEQRVANDCNLRDLALLARAMRLIMIEHAAGSEARDADRERVRTLYNDARSEILRRVQGVGVDPDDPRPLHALAKRIQLDSWPLGGRDREIVTALEQAYQAMMPPPPDRTPPASGRARGR